MNSVSEKSFAVSKTPSISLGSSSSSDKSSPPSTKKSTVRSGSGSPPSFRGSSRGSGRTSATHSSTSTDIYGSYDPFYSQKLIKREFEEESCLRLSNCVAVIGVLSMCIHVVEFFAYTYLLTAYFLIHWDTVPRSTNVWWNVVYPSVLIIHTIMQCSFAVLLIIGAIRKKKSYMLPWIIAECVEILLLAKASIVLAATSDAASVWITATTVAFMSVQVFYVIIAGRLYRRYKREELEVQPPAYTPDVKQPPSPSSSMSNYLYKV